MIGRLILNLAIEFGPIVAFIVATEITSFIKATIIFVILTALSLAIGFIERRCIAWFPLIVGISVIGFGLLTIMFKDPFFIIIKDTLYNGIFSLVLLTGLVYKKPLLKPLFKNIFSMSDRGWSILTMRWAIMLGCLAFTNEVARIYLIADQWVIYKAVATVATIIFSVYQFRLARKERLPDASTWGMRVANDLLS